MTEQQLQRANQIQADIKDLTANLYDVINQDGLDIIIQFTRKCGGTGSPNAHIHVCAPLSEKIMQMVKEDLEASLTEKENDFKDL